MTVEDNATVRHLRNFAIITFLIIFVLAGCFYLTGTLVIVSINGHWEVIKQYSQLDLDKQFIYLFNNLVSYWKFYFTNYSTLTTESYNYFTTKLWVASLLPYTLLLTLAWIFRAPIMDWRPFKKPESIHGDTR